MDEVDRIDVPANDEASNRTETLDVGPSTSSVALAHTCCPCAPTPYLATETLDPPLFTPHDTTGLPIPPIPPIDTGSPLWFTYAEFESSPHATSIDHSSPMASSYSSPPPPSQIQLYSPLAFKHPKLSSCLPARVIRNCLLPHPLLWYMLHKWRNHMMDTLSRGNVIKLSNYTMQTITLHLNGNRLVTSNQRDAA